MRNENLLDAIFSESAARVEDAKFRVFCAEQEAISVKKAIAIVRDIDREHCEGAKKPDLFVVGNDGEIACLAKDIPLAIDYLGGAGFVAKAKYSPTAHFKALWFAKTGDVACCDLPPEIAEVLLAM